MKKFLAEVLVFLIILLISFYLTFMRANGKTDPFYLRFTSPKQHSLILGTSRAAQGIQPSVLDSILPGSGFYNYSFTIGHSPYGPAYLNSIKKKLDHQTKNGIFILSVDPWSISSNANDPNNPDRFRERKLAIGKTPVVNIRPNFFYLINAYDKPFYHLLPRQKSSIILRDDGWLDVKFKIDSLKMEQLIEKKVDSYRKNNLKKYKFSDVRLEYLTKTITYLKNFGRVYLVRLPVHPRMMEIDEEFIPDFDQKIRQISEQTGTPYFDMSFMNDSILYTDGNHIYRESGKVVSARIGEWIAGQEQ
ncbi:MAG TPA: hypothetical protein PLW31_14310 [Bacteroidales bacterium]|nr:hypothetical protein [Bacteroidales bacterium]HOX79199.1 hypothetical protein [Bacteroidales bacterium]